MPEENTLKTDQELRLYAIQIALQSPPPAMSTETIFDLAEKIYKFLKGE